MVDGYWALEWVSEEKDVFQRGGLELCHFLFLWHIFWHIMPTTHVFRLGLFWSVWKSLTHFLTLLRVFVVLSSNDYPFLVVFIKIYPKIQKWIDVVIFWIITYFIKFLVSRSLNEQQLAVCNLVSHFTSFFQVPSSTTVSLEAN